MCVHVCILTQVKTPETDVGEHLSAFSLYSLRQSLSNKPRVCQYGQSANQTSEAGILCGDMNLAPHA